MCARGWAHQDAGPVLQGAARGEECGGAARHLKAVTQLRLGGAVHPAHVHQALLQRARTQTHTHTED